MVKKILFPDDRLFPSAKQEASQVSNRLGTPQSDSPSYRLAYDDLDFMMLDELRAVRLQLEFLKPEIIQQQHNIQATVVIFGSARIASHETASLWLQQCKQNLENEPENEVYAEQLISAQQLLHKSHYYEKAQKLAMLITEESKKLHKSLTIVTGGGPGIMEAANQGALDAKGKSMGFNIILPSEQKPNDYVTPELCFQFHYFAIRKMHFLMRAIALVIFPGGYGTLDELFEALTLIQTKKIRPIPLILFGKPYWDHIINFDAMVSEGTISKCDRDLIIYADSAEQAWQIIVDHYLIDDISD